MKRRTCIMFVIASAITAIFTERGSAQPGPLPQNRPIYSPYLNLLRSGNSPAFNYFGLVRPELNAINSIDNLQQQATNTQQGLNQLQSNMLPATGHAATFMNYGGYFQSRGGAGTTGAIGGNGIQRGGMNGTTGVSPVGGGGTGATPR